MIKVPHNRLSHGEHEANAVATVVRSGRWASGPEVAKLENDLAKLIDRASAVAVGSGLAALRLALIALGTQPGDDIILPAYSCVALPNAVLACGARPVLADVLPESWLIDPVSVRQRCSSRTRAIIAVHTFGASADIAALRQNKVPVIEDCAHGLKVDGMGRQSEVAITSFYATKLIGGGEGGAVMSDDHSILKKVRQWRDYSDQAAEASRLNDKMNEMTAALARCQLHKLDAMIESRATIAHHYIEELKPLATRKIISLPFSGNARIWYRFTLELAAQTPAQLIDLLAKSGIDAQQPIWDWRSGDDQCPMSDRAYRSLISLPIYPTLTATEQAAVIEALLAADLGAAHE